MPFLKDSLFLVSSWNTGLSRAACSSQNWDHGKEHLLGFPSVTPFQWLSSATLYLIDYPFCCNWWNFILFNCWVIILLKIYKHAFLIMKYPCSTRDLGPLCPSFCLWLVLRSVEAYRAHFLPWAFKTSLRGCPVPLWAVQVLCMGFIGFPRNPRDIALSLSFFSSTPVPRSRSVKDCNTLVLDLVLSGFIKKISIILISGLWYLIVVLFWLMMGRILSRAYLPLTSLLWWSTC